MTKLAFKPKVSVIARPQLDWKSVDAFLASLGETWKPSTPHSAEGLVEFAGRICYMAFGQKQHTRETSAYIKKLIENGHGSVLEHAVWSLLIQDISRSCSHQLVRHRVGVAISQLSQQYFEDRELTVVVPTEIASDKAALDLWTHSLEQSQALYSKLLREPRPLSAKAKKREQLRSARTVARSVLPNATATTLVLTANARALLHILGVRGATVGDREMRMLACEIWRSVNPDAPAIFSEFQVHIADDGHEILLRCG